MSTANPAHPAPMSSPRGIENGVKRSRMKWKKPTNALQNNAPRRRLSTTTRLDGSLARLRLGINLATIISAKWNSRVGKLWVSQFTCTATSVKWWPKYTARTTVVMWWCKWTVAHLFSIGLTLSSPISPYTALVCMTKLTCLNSGRFEWGQTHDMHCQKYCFVVTYEWRHCWLRHGLSAMPMDFDKSPPKLPSVPTPRS